jgi:hypothetical protein
MIIIISSSHGLRGATGRANCQQLLAVATLRQLPQA